MAINLEFLMSGRQFVDPAPPAPAPTADKPSEPATIGPKLTETQRLATFMQRTSVAAAAAVAERKAASPPALALNLDFLRSGKQFDLSAHTAAAHNRGGGGGAKTTRAARLEAFSAATLEAAAAAVAAGKDVGINVDFLRSGRQFTPDRPVANPPSSSTTEGGSSRAARLERFYRETLAGHASPPAPRPTGINAVFLRSGRQFVPPDFIGTTTGQTARGARKTREQRLEHFLKQTSRAAAAAAASDAAAAEPPAPVPTVVNLEFLRSSAYRDSRHGKGLAGPMGPASPATARKMARSRYARLEDFYKQTLEAQRPKRMSASG